MGGREEGRVDWEKFTLRSRRRWKPWLPPNPVPISWPQSLIGVSLVQWLSWLRSKKTQWVAKIQRKVKKTKGPAPKGDLQIALTPYDTAEEGNWIGLVFIEHASYYFYILVWFFLKNTAFCLLKWTVSCVPTNWAVKVWIIHKLVCDCLPLWRQMYFKECIILSFPNRPEYFIRSYNLD